LIPPPPLPDELPANTIVVVSHVPVRTGRITKAEFQHALVQAAAQAGRKSAPKPGGNGYGKLKDRATGELLDAVWIRGQAMEMGIGLRSRQVSRELARLKKAAFKDEAQYRRFLREAHFTRRDVHERVEIQILSTKIQERIVAGFTSNSARQKAFEKFITEYEETWRARTVCAPEYVVAERCSNAPAP
jgi:SurA-like protein